MNDGADGQLAESRRFHAKLGDAGNDKGAVGRDA